MSTRPSRPAGPVHRPAQRFTDVLGVATYLYTTESHVRKMVYERRIPLTKVGRLLRFDLAAIDEWVAANSMTDTTPHSHWR